MLQWSAFMALPFQRQMTIAFRASWAVNIFLLGGERPPSAPPPPPIMPLQPDPWRTAPANAVAAIVGTPQHR